ARGFARWGISPRAAADASGAPCASSSGQQSDQGRAREIAGGKKRIEKRIGTCPSRAPPQSYVAFVSQPHTGCSAAWLAHLTGGQGVAGSNPAIPTTFPHRELPHDCRLDVCVGRTSSITSAADSFVRRNVKTLCESLPERRSIAARDALRLRERQSRVSTRLTKNVCNPNVERSANLVWPLDRSGPRARAPAGTGWASLHAV